MNLSEKQQKWINKHLRNELSDIDMQEFNLELENNPEFKQEYIFQQALAKAAKIEAIKKNMELAKINNLLEDKEVHPTFEHVKQNIKAARIKNIKQQKNEKMIKWLIPSVAAISILIFSMLGTNDQLTSELEKDFSDAYKAVAIHDDHIPELQDMGARSDVIAIKINKLQIAYNEKQFPEALALLHTLKDQYNYHEDQLIYVEAAINSQIGSYAKSIEVLDKLIQSNAEIEYKARWLKGLILLKTNNIKQAQNEFTILAKESEKYKFKAKNKLD